MLLLWINVICVLLVEVQLKLERLLASYAHLEPIPTSRVLQRVKSVSQVDTLHTREAGYVMNVQLGSSLTRQVPHLYHHVLCVQLVHTLRLPDLLSVTPVLSVVLIPRLEVALWKLAGSVVKVNTPTRV